LTHRAFAIAIAALVVALDQLTKWLAISTLTDGPVVVVDGFFRFSLAFNTGMSFSLFTGGGQLIAFVGFGVIGFILYVMRDASRRIEAVAFGLLLGGAVGNLLDRVFRGSGLLDGAVVDFIAFDSFPTFNVADMAINVGVLVLLIAAFWKSQ